MLIKFLSGKKKDQTAHVPRDANTRLLIDAGLVEEVPNTSAPAAPSVTDSFIQFYPEPVWSFVRVTMTGRPAIRKIFNYSESTTFANWDEQPASVVVAAVCKAGCPDEIIKRYEAEMKAWLNRDAANANARDKAVQFV